MKLRASRTTRRPGQRGSILVVCMVLCALGTLGVAAWISLLDARGHQAEAGMEALDRRNTYANSRALAYRALYANHLHSDTALAANQTYTLPDGLGAATVRSYATVPLSDATAIRYSKIGITPFRTYTTDVTVDLSDGVGSQEWGFQLRSYNQMLGGDLLIMNPPMDPGSSATLVAGDLNVDGRAVFWDAVEKDFNAGIEANDFLLPNNIKGTTTFETPSGSSVLPLNYPLPLQTTGIAALGPSYAGELDVTQSTANDHNDYATRLIATGASLAMSGFSGQSVGPGPDSTADSPNDPTLEAEIATQSPATLMTTLPGNYPLSSRILNAIADKNNPAFTNDQLFAIYSAQTPLPDDALAYLTSTHSAKIAPRARELHEANGTAVFTDGNGGVTIYLENNLLPHLILTRTYELTLVGQVNPTDATAAAALDPRGIALNNTGSDSLALINFENQNRRRLILAIATQDNATPPVNGFVPQMQFYGALPFPNWDMILDLQNTGAAIDTSPVAGATIIGGIRANRRVEVTSGRLTLTRQYNSDGYESLLSRNAWIEAYRR